MNMYLSVSQGIKWLNYSVTNYTSALANHGNLLKK